MRPTAPQASGEPVPIPRPMTLLEKFPPSPPTPSENPARHMMARLADVGKANMAFYPCGGEREELGEDELHKFLTKGQPKSCIMQCTSRTERFQLALLDQQNGMNPSFINAKEKSFLHAISQDERCRMFSLNDEERDILDHSGKRK